MAEQEQDFDVLETAHSAIVDYAGQPIEIKPLTIGQLPKFVRAVRPVIDALSNLDGLLAGDDAETAFLSQAMTLIETHGDELQLAMASAVNVPLDRIAHGNLIEFVNLVQAVIRVNRDFFGPQIGQLRKGTPQ